MKLNRCKANSYRRRKNSAP